MTFDAEDGLDQRFPRMRGRALLLVAAAAAAVVAGCGGSGDTTTPQAGDLTEVTLQLQWVTQSQFAGYYAAVERGFYRDLGLDVTIVEGGEDVVPALVVDSGAADFAVSWVPRALAPREAGADVVNIAQLFQRSATLQVAFADSGIESVADLAGKKVGSWGLGLEFEMLAGLRESGLDPDADVTLVPQTTDMLAFLAGDIDAAQAMIYNEYAQVLEAVNPETGSLYQPDDLSVINWNDVGTAMLQDGIWADQGRLSDDPAYRETAEKFVEASLRGWIWCRDNPDACVQIVLDNAPILGESHQAWQLNEINALIWPSPLGVGVMDPALWEQTVQIATAEGILVAAPDGVAYVTDIARKALENLEATGLDVVGDGWRRVEVELRQGGA